MGKRNLYSAPNLPHEGFRMGAGDARHVCAVVDTILVGLG